ncbi:MAG: hypothetical protein AAFY25_05465, partial [Pseudomonadota bacterium]
MAETTDTLTVRMGILCRTVAVQLISAVCRWRSFDELNAAITSRSASSQAVITASAIAVLFGLSLVAGSFGWIGLLAFWLVV